MVVALLFAANGLVMAHDGGSHMAGVVAGVDAKANTLTLQDGKQATVIGLTSATKYVKDKKTASLADVKAGLRVVVHVRMEEKTKKYVADEVEIGVADPPKK
jgi:hypothetical protein